ncbi:hypothetical protein [Serratia phage X20]|uniref:Transmembrane protein n=3 Tax=Winklervirus TaxID=2560256 RepID=A0A1Z1LZ65_9CAUD|nr:hypothetical protein FDI23_gp134 [Serratia phage CHI14]YP_010092283.1 hypothetical protein KNT72_gp132 [Serratia phage X20]ARW57557.1 hypothetical protein [Serratia phage CHI14]ARW57832.1 hypothetical protein [Serratia phage CBH8]ARW58105.1 hypothetical protein [Serratia phage X20]
MARYRSWDFEKTKFNTEQDGGLKFILSMMIGLGLMMSFALIMVIIDVMFFGGQLSDKTVLPIVFGAMPAGMLLTYIGPHLVGLVYFMPARRRNKAKRQAIKDNEQAEINKKTRLEIEYFIKECR